MLQPHSPEWYERLSQLQEGYYYPWKSSLSPLNGEDEYLQMLRQLMSPEMVVLEVGCGHGQIPIALAPLCRWIVAYDRTTAFIELARQAAAAQEIANISFIEAESIATLLDSPDFPANKQPFDLIISRRGPLNWVENVRMVARPGTILFVLNPKESVLPFWNDRIPEPLRLANPRTYSRQSSVERRLGLAGLKWHSAWSFDVPEYFAAPRDLYNRLSWGYTPDEVPSFEAVASILDEIYAEYADEQGLAVPHGRFMWQAVVD
ncbi:MAG: class I SAM-dependent methyltransferase [Candidatus Promineifilaceae bacterium]|nr:class I SAM-dependent methyltransferase [Candidatus Promineifilaceae bacterium]